MRIDQPNTLLIISSELDVDEVVARLRDTYELARWTFVYLLEDLLGQAGAELVRSDTFLVRDFAVHGEIDSVLDRIADTYAITAVLPNDEFAVHVAAWANERWGLPGLTLDMAVRFRDKKRMKQIAQLFNIPTAKEVTFDELKSGAATLPVILKPRSLAGAVGVRIITDACELSGLPRDTGDSYQDMSEHQYIIETYNSQPLYQLDAIVLGKQLAFLSAGEYLGKPIDYLAEQPLGYLSVPQEDLEALWRPFAEQVIAAFDCPDGVYHIEAFGDAGAGLELLEIAFRPGGGHTTEMIAFAHGLDLRLLHLALQLGLCESLQASRRCEAWAYMMFPKKHLSRETLHVSHLTLAAIESLPTLSMKTLPRPGDIASGAFFCHKDGLGTFVFCGERQRVAEDVQYVLEHYQVHLAVRGS